MKDIVNPTLDEVRAWACSGQLEPMEDWNLVLADVRLAPVLMELVADPTAGARAYLLGSLYILVGDAVRTGFRRRAAPTSRRCLHPCRRGTACWLRGLRTAAT